MKPPTKREDVYDVVVVGAGAAGVGVSVALKHAGVKRVVLLDRDRVGASFDAWPDETRFITPSFPSHSVGILDLNSIALGTSPAFSLRVEHPTGRQYALYLRAVAKHFALSLSEHTEVKGIEKVGETFRVETSGQTLRAKHVVWAAGEFQYPRLNGFMGSEHCQHTATISRYKDLEGDDFIVIGGYESGVDAAYHLARRGKRVRLFDLGCPWKEKSSDPSIALSTYSLERMRSKHFREQVILFPNVPIRAVTRVGEEYEALALDGRQFRSLTPPLWAGGFEGGHKLVENLFAQREDGFPLLNKHDESTIVPGAFLCGPSLRHGPHIFCFIYKYRQRFAVVAKAIATSLGLLAEELETYRRWGMYLDDLSICGEECEC